MKPTENTARTLRPTLIVLESLCISLMAFPDLLRLVPKHFSQSPPEVPKIKRYAAPICFHFTVEVNADSAHSIRRCPLFASVSHSRSGVPSWCTAPRFGRFVRRGSCPSVRRRWRRRRREKSRCRCRHRRAPRGLGGVMRRETNLKSTKSISSIHCILYMNPLRLCFWHICHLCLLPKAHILFGAQALPAVEA